jgi:protoporphyrin/coproporphyrin ferrochelatase
MSRLAVVLFNLGGPDRLDAVEPFLFNLFNDPAIIGLPWPLRPLLARLISRRRGPTARDIYEQLGGGSPILPQTEKQAAALEERLTMQGDTAKVFIAMRYWQPRADETAFLVKDFAPDEIILLPLYPQYSTTTTASSVAEWHRAARGVGLKVPTHTVCCYPTEPSFIQAQVDLIGPAIDQASQSGSPRVLFSAHGLPKKIISRGDPYAWQVEQTAAAVAAGLNRPGLDWMVCYQSKVGPLEWIGPSTENEIIRAGKEGVPLVVVPIAFVSEHSETLVELDVEYRELAEKNGVSEYIRVAALGANKGYIGALFDLVNKARAGGPVFAAGGARLCPADFRCCGLAADT